MNMTEVGLLPAEQRPPKKSNIFVFFKSLQSKCVGKLLMHVLLLKIEEKINYTGGSF